MLGGDLVIVQFGQNIEVGAVQLDGHVFLPGRRALSSAPTIHGLLGGAESLIEGAYLPFAVLETTEPSTQARRLFAVDLQRILAGEQDFSLRDNDRLVVLSVDDIRFLSSNAVHAAVSAGPETALNRTVSEMANLEKKIDDLRNELETLTRPQSCRGLDTLATIVQVTQSGRFNSAIQGMNAGGIAGEEDMAPTREICPLVFDVFPDMLPFALEHVVAISGEVRRPGGIPNHERHGDCVRGLVYRWRHLRRGFGFGRNHPVCPINPRCDFPGHAQFCGPFGRRRGKCHTQPRRRGSV